MTGAVLEMRPGVTVVRDPARDLRLLSEPESPKLFRRYNDLMNDPSHSADHHTTRGTASSSTTLQLRTAQAQAHACPTKQGLHPPSHHSAGMVDFDPPHSFGLSTDKTSTARALSVPGSFTAAARAFSGTPVPASK